ncbi:MAG: NADH-ubiquinone oxidoreductase chain [Myxococcales bacterium]|nr:NADH-ubiquinone oxidoreductase chain [Myxococcales bacterium]
MSIEALARAKEILGPAVVSTHSYRGDDTVVVKPEGFLESMRILRDDPEVAMNFLSDMTAVDYFGREPRFEVVYHLRSFKTGARLRVKSQLDEPEDGSNPVIDSVSSLWASANWNEREAWDLYGIKFRGHPDLRRILMYEEFIGHPLRKDYPKEKRQPLIRRPPDEV